MGIFVLILTRELIADVLHLLPVAELVVDLVQKCVGWVPVLTVVLVILHNAELVAWFGKS